MSLCILVASYATVAAWAALLAYMASEEGL